jgi:hypothetical protein
MRWIDFFLSGCMALKHHHGKMLSPPQVAHPGLDASEKGWKGSNLRILVLWLPHLGFWTASDPAAGQQCTGVRACGLQR